MKKGDNQKMFVRIMAIILAALFVVGGLVAIIGPQF